MHKYIYCFALLLCAACQPRSETQSSALPVPLPVNNTPAPMPYDTAVMTIHVFVALCDNKFQGIVPVPAAIGNGFDPDQNLYWGCGNGVRTYFSRSEEWKLLKTSKLDSVRLERLVFRHRSKNGYLIADAYAGASIRQCTEDFLNGSAGRLNDTLQIDRKTVGIGGHAALLAYVGHNGLMDFELCDIYQNTDGKKRDCMILACHSKRFFSPHLPATLADPLLWTTGLMCPEAYTLHDALSGYLRGEPREQIRMRAARAYSKHLQCSVPAARKLLASGW